MGTTTSLPTNAKPSVSRLSYAGLSETDAWAIATAWINDLDVSLVCDHDGPVTSIVEHYAWVYIRGALATDHRAAVARYAAVMWQSLSCCAGFGVDENLGFWRRVFKHVRSSQASERKWFCTDRSDRYERLVDVTGLHVPSRQGDATVERVLALCRARDVHCDETVLATFDRFMATLAPLQDAYRSARSIDLRLDVALPPPGHLELALHRLRRIQTSLVSAMPSPCFQIRQIRFKGTLVAHSASEIDLLDALLRDNSCPLGLLWIAPPVAVSAAAISQFFCAVGAVDRPLSARSHAMAIDQSNWSDRAFAAFFSALPFQGSDNAEVPQTEIIPITMAPDEEQALAQLLDDFGEASGLRINTGKCTAGCLAAAGPSAAHSAMKFSVLPKDQHCRLLGTMVASTRSITHVWDHTVQQLRVMLHLATTKTTDLFQRVEICKAIAMAKIAFVARHAWPTGDIIERLQRFLHDFVWTGSLSDFASKRRAWLSADIARLPIADGGIGMPCVRTTLLQLSERTVARWTAASTALAAAVGVVLMNTANSHLHALSRLSPAELRICSTIATTGITATSQRLALPRSDTELRLVSQLLPLAGRGGLASHRWTSDGLLHCDYVRHRTSLAEVYRHQRQTYGDLSKAGLFAAPVVGAGFLLSKTGEHLCHKDMPEFLTADLAIGDVVDLRWIGDHKVAFECKILEFPLRTRAANRFKQLCDLLIFQYPALLRPHNPDDVLQPRPPTLSRWHLRKTELGLVLGVSQFPHQTTDIATVVSTQDAARKARAAGHAILTFDKHPWLDPFFQIWNLRGAPKAVRTEGARHARGIAQIKARELAAHAEDAEIGAALEQLTWSRVARLPDSASSQRILVHKIKGGRLSGWDRVSCARGCPHCAHAGSGGGHTFHIMWHCAATKELWTHVRSVWQQLGLWRRDSQAQATSFLTAVFSLRLPAVPPSAWAYVAMPKRRNSDVADALHTTIQRVWTQHVIACFQAIWTWRQGVHDEDSPWTLAVATAMLRARFTSSLQAIASRLQQQDGYTGIHRLLTRLRVLAIGGCPPPAVAPSARAAYLLFFDGGSRGNPGPGGAGAVIVRIDRQHTAATIVWSAAMSLASSKTTNNCAEYIGLITGLAAAHRNTWTPLHVVGDSALIIGQLNAYRSPWNDILKTLYASARVLADQIGVEQWTHHLRAYNKMADAAANLAMDTRRSFQTYHPTDRPEWAALTQLLAGDVFHWQASQLRSL